MVDEVEKRIKKYCVIEKYSLSSREKFIIVIRSFILYSIECQVTKNCFHNEYSKDEGKLHEIV